MVIFSDWKLIIMAKNMVVDKKNPPSHCKARLFYFKNLSTLTAAIKYFLLMVVDLGEFYRNTGTFCLIYNIESKHMSLIASFRTLYSLHVQYLLCITCSHKSSKDTSNAYIYGDEHKKEGRKKPIEEA